MKNWKDRLIKCGVPEKIAEKVVDFLYRERRMIELIAYVRMTEEATGRNE